MEIAATISCYLPGLLVSVFGLNGFLHFIHEPLPDNPAALHFFVSVATSHFMTLIYLVQFISGVLLLAGRLVPLALAIFAPVLVNILNYHITMDPGGIGPGLSVICAHSLDNRLPSLSVQLRPYFSAASA